MNRNNPNVYPYYVIRGQDYYTTTKIRSQKSFCPKLKVLFDFKCNPNSKTLYIRIKEKLKAKGVSFYLNEIELKDFYNRTRVDRRDEGDK